jgi:hypothetical protein
MEVTVPMYTIPLAPHKPAYHYIMYRTCQIYYYLRDYILCEQDTIYYNIYCLTSMDKQQQM